MKALIQCLRLSPTAFLALPVMLGCSPVGPRPATGPAPAVQAQPVAPPSAAPAPSPPAPSPPQPRLTLRPPLSAEPVVTVSITPQALVVALRGRGGGEPQVVATIARRAGSPPYDYAALNRALADLVRKRWPDPERRPPDSRQLVVSPTPDATYETVIQVMDAARVVRAGPGVTDAGRALFPDVVLELPQ